jgi:archaellum component FlaG (FlaF/FlaG flagellin family)
MISATLLFCAFVVTILAAGAERGAAECNRRGDTEAGSLTGIFGTFLAVISLVLAFVAGRLWS